MISILLLVHMSHTDTYHIADISRFVAQILVSDVKHVKPTRLLTWTVRSTSARGAARTFEGKRFLPALPCVVNVWSFYILHVNCVGIYHRYNAVQHLKILFFYRCLICVLLSCDLAVDWKTLEWLSCAEYPDTANQISSHEVCFRGT